MQTMSMGNAQTMGVGNNSQFAENGSSIAFYLELVRDGVVIHVSQPSYGNATLVRLAIQTG